MVRPIESVEAALAFLEYWRRDRGVVFYFTKVELEKALVGEIDVDQARQAFWRFAEDVNILGENATA